MQTKGHMCKIHQYNLHPKSLTHTILISCYKYIHDGKQTNDKFCRTTLKNYIPTTPKREKKKKKRKKEKKERNETNNFNSKFKKLHRSHRHGIRKLAFSNPLSFHRLSHRFGSHRRCIARPLLLLSSFSSRF